MMLYISRLGTRSFLTWQSVKTVGAIQKFDCGDLSSAKLLTTFGYMNVGTAIITNTSPFMSPVNTSGWRDGKTELGKHSYYNDLLYRVMYGTNYEYVNSGTVAAPLYRYVYWNGYQIGDNWELALRYETSGFYFMDFFCTDITNVPTALNYNIITYPGDAGNLETGEGPWYNGVNAIDGDDGFQPVLLHRNKNWKYLYYS